jgi:hypothetical protein
LAEGISSTYSEEAWANGCGAVGAYTGACFHGLGLRSSRVGGESVGTEEEDGAKMRSTAQKRSRGGVEARRGGAPSSGRKL